MRQVYSDRSRLLAEEANRRLSGLLDVQHAQAGMCTVAWIKIPVTEMVLTQRAEQLGLEVVPISLFVNKYEQKPALFLGFAGCNASEIKRGVSVLGVILTR
jgi:GntR family transcriptional regulator / MocR family aminotransferase